MDTALIPGYEVQDRSERSAQPIEVSGEAHMMDLQMRGKAFP